VELMTKRLLILPILLVVAAFPLAGCGGDDDTDTAAVETSASGGSDEEQITDVIVTVSTTTSRRNCTELETRRFAEQNAAKTGQAAIEDCATNDPGESDADSVDVSNVEVSGDSATAEVAVHGSPFDGQTIAVSLVKEGDQWKLDHVDSFVEFDAQALAKSFAKALGGPQGELTPAQLKCVTDTIVDSPPQTVQQAILSGQSDQVQALFADC
jgi:hypothetical protein